MSIMAYHSQPSQLSCMHDDQAGVQPGLGPLRCMSQGHLALAAILFRRKKFQYFDSRLDINSSQQSTYGIVYRLTSSVACATICAHHEQELRPL